MATFPTPSLFPIVPCYRDTAPTAPAPPEPAGDRVGIARLAALSPLAEAKRGAEYFLLPARSIVNRCESKRVPFPWSINPYRGCEFGCVYCYARYTHEYMELDGEEFERKIFVKQDAGRLAARDLATMVARGEHIAIGSATDPYQPAEAEFRNTRAILEEMARHDGLSVSITTKSNRVVRDIDVLQRIAARSDLWINLTITTPRPRLARLLELRAPSPELRFSAVRALRDASLQAGVFVMPVLPGLTDSEEDLDTMGRLSRDAGAQWFAANVLFLMPSSRKQFMPFLEKKFPRLAKRYHEWYERVGYAPASYRREIVERVTRVRRKYGLSARLEARERAEDLRAGRQLDLALETNGSGDERGESRR